MQNKPERLAYMVCVIAWSPPLSKKKNLSENMQKNFEWKSMENAHSFTCYANLYLVFIIRAELI